MSEKTNLTTSFLDTYPLGNIRRNHGLEHATLHVLARRFPQTHLAGHSDVNGFWIVGQITLEALQSAVEEALARLNKGEARLAIHPNCGTNLVTSGVLAGLAGGGAMFGAGKRTQDKFERLPLAIAFATLALLVAQPLGAYLQSQITTSGIPGALQVVAIQPRSRGRVPAYRVLTRDRV